MNHYTTSLKSISLLLLFSLFSFNISYAIWPPPRSCAVATTCSNGELIQCSSYVFCHSEAGRYVECGNAKQYCPKDEE